MIKVILMERSSPDVWFESFVKVLEEYNAHHRLWFFDILPWLSETHHNLSESKKQCNKSTNIILLQENWRGSI